MKTKPQQKLKPQVDLTFKILSQILPSHRSCATQQKSLLSVAHCNKDGS